MSIVLMTIEEDTSPEDTSPEDTSPRGEPSLWLMVLSAISILAIFALIVWYFKGRKAPESKEEEWIWIEEETTTEGQTNKVKKEIQRKDIQTIKKTGAKVTELVEVVVTTMYGGVYIDYVPEEKIVNKKNESDVQSVIKLSEEDESARKGTMEIVVTDERGRTIIKRINTNELNATKIELERNKMKATERETKEERRNRIKKLKEEEGAGKK